MRDNIIDEIKRVKPGVKFCTGQEVIDGFFV